MVGHLVAGKTRYRHLTESEELERSSCRQAQRELAKVAVAVDPCVGRILQVDPTRFLEPSPRYRAGSATLLQVDLPL